MWRQKSSLGGTKKATIRTYFCDKRIYVGCLETVIATKKSKTGEYVYSILSEKPLGKTDCNRQVEKVSEQNFTGMKPVEAAQ